jgi:hypothetical protein
MTQTSFRGAATLSLMTLSKMGLIATVINKCHYAESHILIVMLGTTCAEFHNAGSQYTEYHYPECRYA